MEDISAIKLKVDQAFYTISLSMFLTFASEYCKCVMIVHEEGVKGSVFYNINGRLLLCKDE